MAGKRITVDSEDHTDITDEEMAKWLLGANPYTGLADEVVNRLMEKSMTAGSLTGGGALIDPDVRGAPPAKKKAVAPEDEADADKKVQAAAKTEASGDLEKKNEYRYVNNTPTGGNMARANHYDYVHGDGSPADREARRGTPTEGEPFLYKPGYVHGPYNAEMPGANHGPNVDPSGNLQLDESAKASLKATRTAAGWENEPRVPAGQSGGGRWTSDGSGGGGSSYPRTGRRRATNAGAGTARSMSGVVSPTTAIDEQARRQMTAHIAALKYGAPGSPDYQRAIVNATSHYIAQDMASQSGSVGSREWNVAYINALRHLDPTYSQYGALGRDISGWASRNRTALLAAGALAAGAAGAYALSGSIKGAVDSIAGTTKDVAGLAMLGGTIYGAGKVLGSLSSGLDSATSTYKNLTDLGAESAAARSIFRNASLGTSSSSSSSSSGSSDSGFSGFMNSVFGSSKIDGKPSVKPNTGSASPASSPLRDSSIYASGYSKPTTSPFDIASMPSNWTGSGAGHSSFTDSMLNTFYGGTTPSTGPLQTGVRAAKTPSNAASPSKRKGTLSLKTKV